MMQALGTMEGEGRLSRLPAQRGGVRAARFAAAFGAPVPRRPITTAERKASLPVPLIFEETMPLDDELIRRLGPDISRDHEEK